MPHRHAPWNIKWGAWNDGLIMLSVKFGHLRSCRNIYIQCSCCKPMHSSQVSQNQNQQSYCIKPNVNTWQVTSDGNALQLIIFLVSSTSMTFYAVDYDHVPLSHLLGCDGFVSANWPNSISIPAILCLYQYY